MALFKPYQFYRKEEIELKAYHVLMDMQAADFIPRWPFDSTYVADALGLLVDWLEICSDKKGSIAARILPLLMKIEINNYIYYLPQGVQQFTIAHEIGHWVLHINREETASVIKHLELGLKIYSDSYTNQQQFLCRLTKEQQIYQITDRHSQLSGIEWQADYFASCLLMPRYKLEELKRGRNLTKWPHLYAMRDELGVTITHLTYRLQDLGWIMIPKGSKQVYLGNSAPGRDNREFG